VSDIVVTSVLVVCAVAFLWRVAIAISRACRTPAYTAKPLMTANEREFFGRLVHAHEGGYVFAQVAMSGLLEPKAGNERARLAAFRRISQRRIDYTLHARDLSLLCVVELDDRTHDDASDRQRDALLHAVGIKTLRFASSDKPTVAQLRSTIAQTAADSTPTPSARLFGELRG
jgi:very-short-patch-repair endonuclease